MGLRTRRMLATTTAAMTIMAVAVIMVASTTPTTLAFAPMSGTSSLLRRHLPLSLPYTAVQHHGPYTLSTSTTTKSTCLHAIGALVKRAKLAEIHRDYVDNIDSVPNDVQAYYQQILERAPHIDLHQRALAQPLGGPLQQTLTRRAGTLTVIAEYKRKLSSSSDESDSKSNSNNGYIAQEIFDPELLSPVFRDFGAAGIAVLADERMGGCNYHDLYTFGEEQRRSKNNVPGPVAVINSDVILSAWQIARTAACNAAAVVLSSDLLVTTTNIDDGTVNTDALVSLLRAAAALDLEAIVTVSSLQQAQCAVDAGARIISVVNVDGIDEKVACISNLTLPSDGRAICKIANILAKNNKQMTEIEEAWAVRDQGFQCAWVSDALYKSGADTTEHPGAIITAMRSKSSLKFASPKAKSGRGEGAREYLGDILM